MMMTKAITIHPSGLSKKLRNSLRKRIVKTRMNGQSLGKKNEDDKHSSSDLCAKMGEF
jgi:hypothetical protein